MAQKEEYILHKKYLLTWPSYVPSWNIYMIVEIMKSSSAFIFENDPKRGSERVEWIDRELAQISHFRDIFYELSWRDDIYRDNEKRFIEHLECVLGIYRIARKRMSTIGKYAQKSEAMWDACKDYAYTRELDLVINERRQAR